MQNSELGHRQQNNCSLGLSHDKKAHIFSQFLFPNDFFVCFFSNIKTALISTSKLPSHLIFSNKVKVTFLFGISNEGILSNEERKFCQHSPVAKKCLAQQWL